MSIDREKLLQSFLSESEEGLAGMEDAVLSLESNHEDSGALQEVFRIVHTIKGNAAALGFPNLRNFAHEIENGLERLGSGSGSTLVSERVVTLLLKITDSLRQILLSAAASNDDQPSPGQQRLAQEFLELISEQGASTTEAGAVGSSPLRRAGLAKRTLRVDVAKLDRLMDLTGEITIAQERVRVAIDCLGEAGRDVLASFMESQRLLSEFQDRVMSVRMVPIESLFRQYVRVVRDLARSEGKLARLVIEADTVEVDTTVIEKLKDPLMHMVRNAIGHGIEKPEERRAAGKPAAGSITLAASQTGGKIVVTMQDDGRGFDRKRILERARAMGMVEPGEEMAESQLLRLVLEPGFSTADSVSELSGRGVGMDVVRRNVASIGGVIQVESRQGEGSQVSLALPLTVAIVDGFAVRVGGEVFIIPMDRIVECLELPATHHSCEEGGILSVHGEGLPFIRLRSAMGMRGARPAVESIVVVEYPGGRFGLAADQLLGEQQAVVKPLGRFFPSIPGIAGSTVLGDGKVALILDVSAICEQASYRSAEAVSG